MFVLYMYLYTCHIVCMVPSCLCICVHVYMGLCMYMYVHLYNITFLSMLCIWYFIVVHYFCIYLDMFGIMYSVYLIECMADLRVCVFRYNNFLFILNPNKKSSHGKNKLVSC